MAWATWREHGALAVERGRPRAYPAHRVIASGVLVNILNPKLTIFFVAFLPQFIPTAPPAALPMVAPQRGVHGHDARRVHRLRRVRGGRRRHVIERPRVVTWMRRAFAGSFVALSAKLALASR